LNLTLKRGALRDALTGLGKVIAGNSTLPILRGVKFHVGESDVRATATDLDQVLTHTFERPEVKSRGAFVADFDALKELSKGSGCDLVEFACTAADQVEIRNHIGAQEIVHPCPTLDVEDWPKIDDEIPVQPADGFLDAFRRVTPFVSRDETRGGLTGIYLDASGKGPNAACIVACDGRRLAACNTMELPVDTSCILPVSKFLLWPKLEPAVEIGSRTADDITWVKLTIGPWEYTVRALAGSYPTWRNVLPRDTGVKRFTFSDEDVQRLKEILPRLPGYDSANPWITLVGTKGKPVNVRSQGPNDAAETRIDLEGGSTYTGPADYIGVNPRFFIDALDLGCRQFGFPDGASPLYCREGSIQHVLMPVNSIAEPEGWKAKAKRGAKKTNAEQAGPAPNTETKPTEAAEKTDNPGGNPGDITEEKKGAKRAMPKEKQGETIEPTGLDRALAACEQAKVKLREASSAVAEMAAAVRDAVRQAKQQKKDVDAARNTLAKLKDIAL